MNGCEKVAKASQPILGDITAMSAKYICLAGALATLLAGCGNLPRGAGLQSEVLSKADVSTKSATGEAPVPTEFAVEPITRDSLGLYEKWPAVGEPGLSWLGRVDMPNSRIVAPGDMLNITIWNAEDNSLLTTPGQRFTPMPPMQVSSGGQIFLPYVGQVKVAGLTVDKARAKIEEAYVAVAPSVQVQLATTEGRQSTVSVVGGVTRPGPYPLRDQDVTILDVVAESGGALPAIANPQLRLQRGNRTYGISLERLMRDASLNTTMAGGDRVFIEDDQRYFLSLGAAGSKAQHHFPQDSVSALDALSIIGGLAADRANAQGILVLRDYPARTVRQDGLGPRHSRTIFTIDLTTADGLFSAGQFHIRPGDLIYVTESPLIGTRNFFSVIGAVFGIATQASNL